MDAARFLKKSGLSDITLSRIWDLSDPKGTGQLDKLGFFTALKLITLQQQGEVASLSLLFNEIKNPPKCGEIPKKILDGVKTITCISPSTKDWSIEPNLKKKYEDIFESMVPENGLLTGNKVRDKMMQSKLPLTILGKIWDLADQDKDGNLDIYEFTNAWHLMNIALTTKVVPNELPNQLKKSKGDYFVASFPDLMLSSVEDLKPQLGSILNDLSASNEYSEIPNIQKLKYEEVFKKVDLDCDGLVSGAEIKNIFLNTGLSQKTLAEIWTCCDAQSRGKLSSEQFALAMWMIENKQKELKDPPQSLISGNTIMPSYNFNKPQENEPFEQFGNNTEVQLVLQEIKKLTSERILLEAEISQKEADIKIKNGESRSLEVS